ASCTRSGPASMAAVAEVSRADPEARPTFAWRRRSEAAVKTAFDKPLSEPVPARLLTAAGAESGTIIPFVRRKLGANRSMIMALAASLAALAIGFGAGQWQATPAGTIYLANGPTDGAGS